MKFSIKNLWKYFKRSFLYIFNIDRQSSQEKEELARFYFNNRIIVIYLEAIKLEIIYFFYMSDNCELKWQPTQDQLDNLILPAYTEMAKQSVAYVNKFGCPPEYVADMLRDIADALNSIHPESDSQSDCSCC